MGLVVLVPMADCHLYSGIQRNVRFQQRTFASTANGFSISSWKKGQPISLGYNWYRRNFRNFSSSRFCAPT